MSYERFTTDVMRLFRNLLPFYIGTVHETSGDKIKIKDDGTPVGNLDTHALELLRNLISDYFPGDFTLGEEDKKDEEEIREILAHGNQLQWMIDGLDGTGNRRMRSLSYGAAIARKRGREILYAAIFRPTDEKLYGDGFFWAERGGGARQWCGDCKDYHSLKTAAPGALERITVMLEGSSKKFFKPPLTELGKAITTRPSWSSSIAATTVALGKASAFVTIENKPWDNWPAWLLIEEAGGIVTDWNGGVLTPENCGNMVAAANETDHATILKFLAHKEEGR